MDIYIKNIEMPITCRDCPIGNPKLKTCYLLNEPKRNLERRSDCPLIAVSPHGDLIDRDALIDTLSSSDRDIYVKCTLEEDAAVVIEGNL